jgi:hypothetical protein
VRKTESRALRARRSSILARNVFALRMIHLIVQKADIQYMQKHDTIQ